MSILRNLLFPRGFTIVFAFLATLYTATLNGCAHSPRHNALFQTSTISALSQGMYNGDMSFSQLRQQGDFGIGTFNDLDGEMIALDGFFYQAKTDGNLYPLSLQETKTPFATVTFFSSDITQTVNRQTTQAELKQTIDRFLKSQNIFYAIKVKGTFPYIKVRSVPAQKKPYPALDTAVQDQVIFEFENIKGTLVGFWCPAYAPKINVPGYHFHFISKDKKKGGHVLDFTITNATIAIDEKTTIEITLPSTEDFYTIDTARESQGLAEK